ncbi:MAG: type I-C CRISPR-associated protein Cas8c/Csd1 [Magnetococcus sp. XQGC-1]
MLDLLLQQAGESEPGFASETIKWAIHCTGEGRFTGVTALGEEGKGQLFAHCPKTPNMNAGGKSHFLADSLAAVVLFFDDEPDGTRNHKIKEEDRDRFGKRHSFFLDLLRQAQEVLPALAAPVHMVEDAEQRAQMYAALKQNKAKPTEMATFALAGEIFLASREWHEWWRSYLRPSAESGAPVGALMRDFVTGALVKPAGTHPKVTGLAGVGGLGTGDVLAGFDKEAFQSFGLEKSCNAAMSNESATAYAETLNRLIREKRVRLGNTLCTYWFTESIPDDDNPLSWIEEPEESTRASAEQRAKVLLEAIRSGQRAEVTGCRYVALLLSGAAGRVMVRDVMQDSFEGLAAHVVQWFQDLAIVHREGKTMAPAPKLLAIAGALVRELKDLPPPVIQQLWRAALTGAGIPHVAMAQATLRARMDVIADASFNHARMGLIKAFHVRQGDQEMQPYLNPEHPSSAYQCGRLLAVLAGLQRAALGDVGAGVVQRYYTAASQTPGMVLGRLVANAKNHLGKLDGGLSWWYEERIAEVMSRLGDQIPLTHSLQEQSLFALGYYQQLAFSRAGKQTDIAPASPSD